MFRKKSALSDRECTLMRSALHTALERLDQGEGNRDSLLAMVTSHGEQLITGSAERLYYNTDEHPNPLYFALDKQLNDAVKPLLELIRNRLSPKQKNSKRKDLLEPLEKTFWRGMLQRAIDGCKEAPTADGARGALLIDLVKLSISQLNSYTSEALNYAGEGQKNPLCLAVAHRLVDVVEFMYSDDCEHKPELVPMQADGSLLAGNVSALQVIAQKLLPLYGAHRASGSEEEIAASQYQQILDVIVDWRNRESEERVAPRRASVSKADRQRLERMQNVAGIAIEPFKMLVRAATNNHLAGIVLRQDTEALLSLRKMLDHVGGSILTTDVTHINISIDESVYRSWFYYLVSTHRDESDIKWGEIDPDFFSALLSSGAILVSPTQWVLMIDLIDNSLPHCVRAVEILSKYGRDSELHDLMTTLADRGKISDVLRVAVQGDRADTQGPRFVNAITAIVHPAVETAVYDGAVRNFVENEDNIGLVDKALSSLCNEDRSQVHVACAITFLVAYQLEAGRYSVDLIFSQTISCADLVSVIALSGEQLGEELRKCVEVVMANILIKHPEAFNEYSGGQVGKQLRKAQAKVVQVGADAVTEGDEAQLLPCYDDEVAVTGEAGVVAAIELGKWLVYRTYLEQNPYCDFQKFAVAKSVRFSIHPLEEYAISRFEKAVMIDWEAETKRDQGRERLRNSLERSWVEAIRLSGYMNVYADGGPIGDDDLTEIVYGHWALANFEPEHISILKSLTRARGSNLDDETVTLYIKIQRLKVAPEEYKQTIFTVTEIGTIAALLCGKGHGDISDKLMGLEATSKQSADDSRGLHADSVERRPQSAVTTAPEVALFAVNDPGLTAIETRQQASEVQIAELSKANSFA